MYEHTFFTPERLAELFDMFGALIKLASPAVIIWVAFAMAGMLITFIVVMFKKGSDPDDDNQDYDIKHY